MRLLGTIVFAIMVLPAFAATQAIVKCRVDNVANSEMKKNVPVTIIVGAKIVKTKDIRYL